MLKKGKKKGSMRWDLLQSSSTGMRLAEGVQSQNVVMLFGCRHSSVCTCSAWCQTLKVGTCKQESVLLSMFYT